jgi:hypothetical protein
MSANQATLAVHNLAKYNPIVEKFNCADKTYQGYRLWR